MEADTVIKVENLYKKFSRSLKRSMAYGSIDIARNMLGIPYDNGILRKSEFWSLEDVSFELKQGEALGIIGQNGSGKSTLLRLINGIYPPDKGTISVRGKIGALIAVGAGFQPHMTGRENIFLNGTILGMSQQEIKEKFNDIVSFADLGDFMDAPVATYSSGMTIRLGFSIAIHSDPEILLADEILAVGDLGFALKCYRKIAEYREKGGSIILVSHSIQLIRNTCNRVLWMDKGKVLAYGDAQSVCDKYENFILQKDVKIEGDTGNLISNDPLVKIEKVEFIDKNGEAKGVFTVGETLTIRMYYNAQRKVKDPVITTSITNPENILVVSNYTSFDNFKVESIEGKGYFDFTLDNLGLKPTIYKFSLTLTENGDINNHIEWHDKMYTFEVLSNGTTSYGIYNPFPKWSINDKIDSK